MFLLHPIYIQTQHYIPWCIVFPFLYVSIYFSLSLSVFLSLAILLWICPISSEFSFHSFSDPLIVHECIVTSQADGKAGSSLHFHFPRGKIEGWGVCTGGTVLYRAVLLWGKNNAHKMILSFYPVQHVNYWIFLFQCGVGTSLLDFWAPIHILSSMGCCQNWFCFGRIEGWKPHHLADISLKKLKLTRKSCIQHDKNNAGTYQPLEKGQLGRILDPYK